MSCCENLSKRIWRDFQWEDLGRRGCNGRERETKQMPAFRRSEVGPARENSGLYFGVGVRGAGTDVPYRKDSALYIQGQSHQSWISCSEALCAAQMDWVLLRLQVIQSFSHLKSGYSALRARSGLENGEQTTSNPELEKAFPCIRWMMERKVNFCLNIMRNDLSMRYRQD